MNSISNLLRARLSEILALSTLSFCTTGCEVATSTRPIGSVPAPLQDLHLEGSWRSADGHTFYLRVTDPAAGQLEVVNVVTNAQGFQLEHHEVLLRREGDAVLANIRPTSPEPSNTFLFGRLIVQENSLVLMLGPINATRQLTLDGIVRAEVSTNLNNGQESYTVTVTNDFQRLATELASPSGWRWLDTGHPIVLTQQKAGLD